MKKQKISYGTNLIGMNAWEFIEQLPEHWRHSRSEEGWSRWLNWMTGRVIYLEYDENGTITAYRWD